MLTYFRRLLASLMIAAVAPCLAEPLSLDTFLDPTGLVFARLSPDSKQIAAIRFDGSDYALMLGDVDTLKFRRFYSRRIHDGHWVIQQQPISLMWLGNELLGVNYNVGADSVNLKGDHVMNLGQRLIGTVPREEGEQPAVLTYSDLEDRTVLRMNAVTGARTRFIFPGGTPVRIAYDRYGEPRALTTLDTSIWKSNSVITNWYRPSATARWEKLVEFKVSEDFWIPMYVPDEANSLVISSRLGRDTYAIFAYDTVRRSIGEMMAGHPQLDILSVDGIDRAAFERVWTSGMVPQQVWFDPVWARLQRSVDAVLPNRLNVLTGDPAKRLLIHSSSDVDPGSWHLLEVAGMSLTRIGRQREVVDPGAMQAMKSISYPAKDGLSIPAFLTRPAGASGPGPVVIMIHGGPTERDTWHWTDDVQFLASRGYTVLQPQFRGSSGFGLKFEQAGYGQWGMAMQDDVTASVDYLIKLGVADPDRICIYGASYGGYAAMWGLVKTPDLYKCAISFAGVSDLGLMWRDSSDRTSSKAALEVMRTRIGDPDVNRQLFEQVSPLRHAAAIKVPVLLMHGEKDERVPIVHGEKMKQALEKAGKQVSWVTFEKEGHGLYYLKNQRRYYEEMEKFLSRHIGPPPTAEVATTRAQ